MNKGFNLHYDLFDFHVTISFFRDVFFGIVIVCIILETMEYYILLVVFLLL